MIDIDHDESVGFQLITTDDIDDFGIPFLVQRIRQRVGDSPVYLRCAMRLQFLHNSAYAFTVLILMSSVGWIYTSPAALLTDDL
jgi:hypothetical protein